MAVAPMAPSDSQKPNTTMLRPRVYEWFTVAFDTKDLKEPKPLLDELK